MRKVLFLLAMMNICFSAIAIAQTADIQQLKEKANRGDTIAQYQLGRYYTTIDKEQAFYWFKKAAEQGNAQAQYDCGMFYDVGYITEDEEQAFYWFKKAAEQGHVDAQLQLGWCFYAGSGTEKDEVKSFYWYKKAADQGDKRAQCVVGCHYEKGEGVTQDYGKAVTWYRKAALQNNTDAARFLGVCYYEGRGVEKDYAKALGWFKKADSNPISCYYIGLCYENGNGVTKDYTQAEYWYEKAAIQGNEKSKKRLDNIRSKKIEGDNDDSSKKYNDVIVFDLKGKVKSCEVREISSLALMAGSSLLGLKTGSYSFTIDGKYIPNEGEKVSYEGKILNTIEKEGDIIQYTIKDGRLDIISVDTFVFDFIPISKEDVFIYDNSGRIIKKTSKNNGKERETVYSDYKFDSRGNWTSRQCKTDYGSVYSEYRTIIYY